MAGFDGIGFDIVGVYHVEDDHIAIASVGCDGEPTSLVAEELAIEFADGHEDVVGFIIVWCLGGTSIRSDSVDSMSDDGICLVDRMPCRR